jgi:glycosyltransferase involved in cell wall biosynthesis
VADIAVSVVITTHDRPGMVHEAVESARNQTLRDIEVVVVDDGSTEPVRLTGSNVRIIRNEAPVGVSEARNLGLEAARGDWVTFLDDDDILLPRMAETSLRAARETSLPSPIGVLGAMEVVDTVSGRVTEVRIPATQPKGSHYFLDGPPEHSYSAGNTLIAPASLLRSIGGWDGEVLVVEQDELFLRLNEVCSILGIPIVTYRMRAHDGKRLHQQFQTQATGMVRTVEKHRRTFQRFPSRHAHYVATAGAYYLQAGKWAPAIRATTKGMVISPSAKRLRWWLGSLGGPVGLRVYRAIRSWFTRSRGSG